MAGEGYNVEVLSVFRPFLDDETLAKTPGRIARNDERFRKLLGPMEGWIMTIQSLLVWESPTKSILMLVCVNLAFWAVSVAMDRVIAVVAWGFLTVYLIRAWKELIWPTIRVPPKFKEDTEDWTPLHPTLLSVPDISRYLAEWSVTTRLYVKALRNMRLKRRSAFLVLIWTFCGILFVIGHYFSGLTMSYVIIMSVILWPCVTYHKLFHSMYVKFEPYMMALQYKLKLDKLKRKPREKRKAPVDLSKDRAETDSDCDPNDYPPPSNPGMNAALAKVITDSEDESLSLRGQSREHSIGYNSDLENMGEDNELPDVDDLTTAQHSLIPEVSMMPDFENVCEDSNTFMLDDDFMPSLDECDRSRNPRRAELPHCDNTGSECESLPYDDPAQNIPMYTAPATSQSLGLLGSDNTSQSLTATVLASTLSGLGRLSQTVLTDKDDPDGLLRHPQDRMGNAGDSSDSDFEILDRDELERHDIEQR